MAHGYGLTGSGSNLWTREVARALVRDGHAVHLLCQESRPEAFDFVSRALAYDADGRPRTLFERESAGPGRCIVHRPDLEVLPTFVRPQVRSDYVFSILDLDAGRIEEYVRRNVAALSRIVRDEAVGSFHVNHVLLLSEAFRRLQELHGVPYAVMPHGSALEYVVKKDREMREVARRALEGAALILVLNRDVRRRLEEIFPDLSRLDQRSRTVRAGVDTDRFRLVAPGERGRAVGTLASALAGRERGRRPGQTRTFLDALDALDSRGEGAEAAFRAAAGAAADHVRRHPDHDAEERLARVPWGKAPVLLHVGRFVGGKGVPSVVTALPGILERHPGAHLVMAGAGPLREPMEALVHAMRTGRRELLHAVLAWGDDLDPDGYGAFEASRRYLRRLEARGGDGWLRRAASVDLDRVVFTGYLDHEVLSRLYPLCDVAVFPSLVAEASPLVVAEAAASGCFPMGTDFAGMRRTLDAVGEGLDDELRVLMRLRPDPERLVDDIVHHAAGVLDRLPTDGGVGAALREVAVRSFDWRRIGEALAGAMAEIAVTPPRA